MNRKFGFNGSGGIPSIHSPNRQQQLIRPQYPHYVPIDQTNQEYNFYHSNPQPDYSNNFDINRHNFRMMTAHTDIGCYGLGQSHYNFNTPAGLPPPSSNEAISVQDINQSWAHWNNQSTSAMNTTTLSNSQDVNSSRSINSLKRDKNEKQSKSLKRDPRRGNNLIESPKLDKFQKSKRSNEYRRTSSSKSEKKSDCNYSSTRPSKWSEVPPIKKKKCYAQTENDSNILPKLNNSDNCNKESNNSPRRTTKIVPRLKSPLREDCNARLICSNVPNDVSTKQLKALDKNIRRLERNVKSNECMLVYSTIAEAASALCQFNKNPPKFKGIYLHFRWGSKQSATLPSLPSAIEQSPSQIGNKVSITSNTNTRLSTQEAIDAVAKTLTGSSTSSTNQDSFPAMGSKSNIAQSDSGMKPNSLFSETKDRSEKEQLPQSNTQELESNIHMQPTEISSTKDESTSSENQPPTNEQNDTGLSCGESSLPNTIKEQAATVLYNIVNEEYQLEARNEELVKSIQKMRNETLLKEQEYANNMDRLKILKKQRFEIAKWHNNKMLIKPIVEENKERNSSISPPTFQDAQPPSSSNDLQSAASEPVIQPRPMLTQILQSDENDED